MVYVLVRRRSYSQKNEYDRRITNTSYLEVLRMPCGRKRKLKKIKKHKLKKRRKRDRHKKKLR